MTRAVATGWFVLLCLLSAGGCAQVPKDAGFGDLQQVVSERVDYRIHWKTGAPEDAEVSQAIENLLSNELTVDAVIQIALLNNHSLQSTYEKLGVSQADLVQAGLLHNPVFFGSARFPLDPPSKTNLEFGVAQNFLDLLMLPARKNLAAAQFEMTRLQVADEVLGLATEVRRAYFEALGAKQLLQMKKLVSDAGRASYQMALRLHQAGNLSDLNLAKEHSQYEKSRVALAKTQLKLLEVRERLNVLMGLWGPQTNWKIPDGLPDMPEIEIPLENLESLAIANRLDLAGARKEMEVLAQALGITLDWRWVASAEVGVSAERDTDDQWVVGPSLSLELPIFDQGQAKISRLEAQLRQANKRMTALAVEIRSEVRSLRDRLVMTRNLIQHYREVIIPLRERIVELTQKEYNYMLAGVFELLLVKQEELDAYQDYIEAVQGYWITRAELQRAVGGKLPSPPSAGVPEGKHSPALHPGTPDEIPLPGGNGSRSPHESHKE